jgi:hypothetical protein
MPLKRRDRRPGVGGRRRVNTKQENIKSLRISIDATPQVVAAVKAKSRNSAEVVAININKEGILTMFTKVGVIRQSAKNRPVPPKAGLVFDRIANLRRR